MMNETRRRGCMAALVAAMVLVASGCGSNATTQNQPETSQKESESGKQEEYFVWSENKIVDFTEEGKKQIDLIIPEECEGFDGAFFMNTTVENIRFEDDDEIELNGAFIGAETLVSIQLPDNQTVIPAYSFDGCKNLTAFNVPADVSVLEPHLFGECKALAEIEWNNGNLRVIDNDCFNGCTSLSKVNIPEGVERIGEYAFFGCSSLKTVSISSTVRTIEFGAFVNTALEEIHFTDGVVLDDLNEGAFGEASMNATAYIVKGSWLDQHKDILEQLRFKDIQYEE